MEVVHQVVVEELDLGSGEPIEVASSEKDPAYFRSMFSAIRTFYTDDLFCDVVLLCQDSREIRCHALVLASIVPAFRNLLQLAEPDPVSGRYHLHLPDVMFKALQAFVDTLYEKMADEDDELVLDVDADLANVLGMGSGLDYAHPAAAATAAPPPVPRLVLPDEMVPKTETGEVDYDAFNRHAHVVKAVRALVARSPPIEEEDEEHKHLADVVVEESIYCSHLTATTAKGILSRLDNLVLGFCRHQGVFRARSRAYYSTARVTDDEKNILLTNEGAAKQFRMKLPPANFVALVALGVRTNENIAHTLAVRTPDSDASKSVPWSDETTMVNIVNMAKNICGTSFGVILRHPRCSEPNQGKISRDFVDKFKSAYAELSKLEKTNIATECQKYLNEFDTEAPRLKLDHLPYHGNLMEFQLVNHIKNCEVTDYALVYGDSGRQLTIRSLFNFNIQSLSDIRTITILLDLLACFVGFGNQKRVTELSVLQDTFDNYARKTCQSLAVQELGIYAVDVKGRLNDLSGSAIMADDARFVIQSKRKADLEKVLNLPPRKMKKAKTSSSFCCNLCDAVFESARFLNTHVSDVHSDLKQLEDEHTPKSCILCSRVVRDNEELKKHMRNYHKQSQCQICKEAFPGLSHLQAHYAKAHSKVMKCEICGVECKGRAKLKNHKINKHMEEHEKPYVCHCGKGFAEKSKLKSHQMNIHIRTRPYKCRIEGCSSDFNELANRNAHERMVHKYDFRKQVHNIKMD